MAQTDTNVWERLKRALVPIDASVPDGPWELKTGSSGGVAGSTQVEGITAAAATFSGDPVVIGGVDSNTKAQNNTISSTGGLQVTQDTINTTDDNIAATSVSSYPAQATFTSAAESSTTFTFSLSTAGPAAQQLGSLELAFELTSLGRTITAITVKPQDTIGSTTAKGPTYNIYNTVPSNINVIPTLTALADNAASLVYLPIFDRGGYKTLVVSVTFSGATTAAGTCKCQLRMNPYMMVVGPEYLVYGNLTGQAVVTNTTLVQSPGTNNRLYLLSALITNDNTTAGTAKIVNNDTNKVPMCEGRCAAPGGWQTPYYGPIGLPATAQAQAVNLTTTGVGVLDCWAVFRVGA